MELSAFRGFTPVHAPCVFVSPIDQSVIYPYAKYVVIEPQGGVQSFLLGHNENITCIDMSPKGRMIATGENGVNSDVIVWKYQTKSELFRFSEHDGGVLCVGFSQDERLLATYGEEGRLIIWDMASGNIVTHRQIRRANALKWGGRVPDIKGRPTKTFYLASAYKDGVELHVIDPQNGTISSLALPMGKYTRTTTSFAFTDEHLICATTSADFLIFELHSKTLVKVIPAGANGISDIYTAPDGGYLASAGNGEVFSVTATEATSISNCKHPIAGIYNTHVLTTDGYLISNQKGEIWQSHTVPVTSIDCCGNVGVSAAIDRTIKVWDDRKLDCSLTFDSGFRSKPLCVSLSTHLLVAGFENGALGGFDFTTGERLFEILHCQHTAVTAVEIAPTRRFFATGGDDTNVRLWDVRTREMLHHFKHHQMQVTSLRFLPTSTHFYSASADKSVCMFDVAAEKMIYRLTTFDSSVRDIDIHDDFLLTVTQDGHIEKFCISQATAPVANIKSHEINAMAISPDGSKFACGHINGKVSLWDFNSMRQIKEMDVHSSSVSDLRFFANNRFMTSAEDGGLAVIQVQ